MGRPFHRTGARRSFRPTDFANLAGWYDAADNATLLKSNGSPAGNGEAVALIADKSGNSGTNCLCLNGVAGNKASIPDAAYWPTGDIDVRLDMAMDDWTPSAVQSPIGKWEAAGQRSWALRVNTNGTLLFLVSADGTASVSATSTAAPTVSNFGRLWIRVTVDVDNGAAGNTFTFYTSSDGATWTQLGDPVVNATATSIFDGTASVFIGDQQSGTAFPFAGRVYRAQVLSGIGGTVVLDANFALASKLATSFTESSSNAATVTINTSGDLGARIAGERDLYQGTAANQPIYLPHTGTNYLATFGVNDYISTPDSAAFPTADIDIRWHGRLSDYTAASDTNLVTKYGSAGQRSFRFLNLTDNRLYFGWSADGTTELTAVSTAVGTTDGTDIWYRVTLDADAGAANKTVVFYRSTDGVTWTTITTATTAGTTSIFDSTTTLQASISAATGTTYRVSIASTIGGAAVIDFDPSRYTSGTTFTASTGEVWTLNGGAAIVTRTCAYFDGSNDYMKAPAFSLSQPESRYFVGSQVTWTAGDVLFGGNNDNDGNLYQKTSSPNLGLNAGTLLGDNGNLAVGTIGVVASVLNGASSAIRVNRGTATSGNAGSTAANGFTLACRGAGTTLHSNITFSEAAIYAAAHDTASRDKFVNYAVAKHRIAV